MGRSWFKGRRIILLIYRGVGLGLAVFLMELKDRKLVDRVERGYFLEYNVVLKYLGVWGLDVFNRIEGVRFFGCFIWYYLVRGFF